MEKLLNLFHDPMEKRCFFMEPFDVLENQSPYYLVFPTSHAASQWGGGELAATRVERVFYLPQKREKKSSFWKEGRFKFVYMNR
jgi:hypothetical protein